MTHAQQRSPSPDLEDQPDERLMEARIARIESDVAHIQQNLATVQVDIGKLRDGLDWQTTPSRK